MTDIPNVDENTPPEDYENVVTSETPDVEIAENQNPVPDFEEDDV